MVIQFCCKWGSRVGPPQFLADHLTLSQPGGGHILPTQYYEPSRIFRPCDGPEVHWGDYAHHSNYYLPSLDFQTFRWLCIPKDILKIEEVGHDLTQV